jgi:hypothetical protein
MPPLPPPNFCRRQFLFLLILISYFTSTVVAHQQQNTLSKPSPLVRTTIRLILNLPEQSFSTKLQRNNSAEFKQAAEELREALATLWHQESAYRGANVLRFRYQQVLGTIVSVDAHFALPANSSTAVLHRLRWELVRALRDGQIGWMRVSADGFKFSPVEGVGHKN